MKKLFIVFTVPLFVLSCDLLLLSGTKKTPQPGTIGAPVPDAPVVPADIDKDFISFAGERYEKYYWALDPAYYDTIVPLSASADVPFSPTSRTETFTFSDFRLGYFFRPGTYLLSYNGFIWYQTSSVPTQANFNTSAYFTIGDLFSDINYRDEYKILTNFTSALLSLPKTAPYSSPYSINRNKTYRYYTISTSQLYSLSGSSILFDFFHLSPLQPSASTDFHYHLESRDFYQYKTIAIVFDPDLLIYDHGLHPDVQPIVYSYNFTGDSHGLPYSWNNSVTITFRDYNEPYVGSVFSYWVEENGELIEKTLVIEE